MFRLNAKALLMSLCLAIFMSLSTAVCQGAWTLQFELWSSPYAAQKIYAGSLNYSWHFSEELSGKIILPLRVTIPPLETSPELLFPSLILRLRHPFDLGVTGRLEIKCDPQRGEIHFDGGVEFLSDPVLIQYSMARQKGINNLNAGVLFAVNEKWALGAHLKYGRHSLLTYQIHHTTIRGGNTKFSYSHSPDGTLQCLGLEIAF